MIQKLLNISNLESCLEASSTYDKFIIFGVPYSSLSSNKILQSPMFKIIIFKF